MKQRYVVQYFNGFTWKDALAYDDAQIAMEAYRVPYDNKGTLTRLIVRVLIDHVIDSPETHKGDRAYIMRTVDATDYKHLSPGRKFRVKRTPYALVPCQLAVMPDVIAIAETEMAAGPLSH